MTAVINTAKGWRLNLLPHAALSGAAGAVVWAATGEPLSVPIAMAAGVLPDLDHLVDYYNWFVRRDRRRLFLLLHGWEYLVAGILVYFLYLPEPWLLAVLAGYATQIGGDQVFNRQLPYTYFIAVRAAMGFDRERCSRADIRFAPNAVINALPFGKDRARRWFESRM